MMYAKQSGKTVIQKYLAKGHTQMEVDSAHSLIERKLKNTQIYSPAGYVAVMEGARATKPYKVRYVDHTFFKDYSGVKYRQRIRVGDPQVHDLVALRYKPDETIQHKLTFGDAWEDLPQRTRTVNHEYHVTNLYESQLEITAQKYTHLQQLKVVIPPDVHAFYDNLPHHDN